MHHFQDSFWTLSADLPRKPKNRYPFERLKKIILLFCANQSQFEYNDAGKEKSKHKETRSKISKIIKKGELVNGEFSIFDEVLGEGSTGIVYKGR